MLKDFDQACSTLISSYQEGMPLPSNRICYEAADLFLQTVKTNPGLLCRGENQDALLGLTRHVVEAEGYSPEQKQGVLALLSRFYKENQDFVDDEFFARWMRMALKEGNDAPLALVVIGAVCRACPGRVALWSNEKANAAERVLLSAMAPSADEKSTAPVPLFGGVTQKAGIFSDVCFHTRLYYRQNIIINIAEDLLTDRRSLKQLADQIAFLKVNVHANVIVAGGGNDSGSERVRSASAPETVGLSMAMLVEALSNAVPLIQPVELDPFKFSSRDREDSFVRLSAAMHQACKEELFVPVLPMSKPGDDFHEGFSSRHEVDLVELAKHFGARRLILCDRFPGIFGSDNKFISEISPEDGRRLITCGLVKQDQRGKLAFACRAMEEMKVGGVAFVDGRFTDSVLREVLTREGCGTLVRFPENAPASAGVKPLVALG